MACPRVSYRRRTHYATRSNRVKLIRTPGNKLVAQKRQKTSQGPHCPWVLGHKRLAGTTALRHTAARNSSSRCKTVSRPYGGVLSHDQVRDRIVRAFLIEEQRMVKKVLQAESKYNKDKKRRDAKRKRQNAKKDAIAKKVAAKVNVTVKVAPKKAVAVAAKKSVAKAAPKAVKKAQK